MITRIRRAVLRSLLHIESKHAVADDKEKEETKFPHILQHPLSAPKQPTQKKETFIPASFSLLTHNSSHVKQLKTALTKVNQDFKTKTNIPSQLQGKYQPHLFDVKTTKRWYLSDSFVQGAINKYVEYVFSDDLYVRSKNPQIEAIGNDFIKNINLVHNGRIWLRRALNDGTGYMEIGTTNKVPSSLKVVDTGSMFIKQKETGELIGYGQKRTNIASMNANNITEIDKNKIIHYSFNRVDDSPYGYGLIFPAIPILKKKEDLINDQSILIKRKSNSPIIVTMGQRDTGKNDEVMPTSQDITNMQQKLAWLAPYHEWVVPPYVQFDKLDFGDLGKQFRDPIDMCTQELIFAFQVPAVLMGVENIPEGLATKQAESWHKRITSIREEITVILKEQLFSKLFEAQAAAGNPLNINDLELVWGKASVEERQQEAKLLLDVLNYTAPRQIGPGMFEPGKLSPEFAREIEDRLRELLDFEQQQQTRQEEDDQPQPPIPPEQLRGPVRREEGETTQSYQPRLRLTHIDHVYSHLDIDHVHDAKLDDVPLKEYVGFDFEQYIADILSYLSSEAFIDRTFTTFRLTEGINEETGLRNFETLEAHYNLRELFGDEGVATLRTVLANEFKKGSSVATIARELDDKMSLNDRVRALKIARTESIRASNEGALTNYETNDIPHAQWIATVDERSCPYCDAQNGKVVPLQQAREQIPSHPGCRCSWGPVTS